MPTLTWQIQITNPNLTPIRGLTEAVNGLRAATGQAATSIDTLTGHTQALSRQLAQTGQAAQQHGSALVGFFQQAASAAAGFLAANVLQQIVGGLTNIGQAAITSAASMEQTRAGFTTLLGSAQQADALIAQLQQEANKSPFELANFRQGAQLLLGMGVAADQIVPRLRNVSNVVAAVGGTPETFNRITLALGQIQAKGKVSAEEINQLAENGLPGWDILAQALGKTRADVIDLAQQGKLSADVWNQAFTQFAQSDRISKAADAQSHTFNGLLSTIRDIGTALGNAFGGPLIAAVEPTLERIVASLQDPQVTATLAQWGAAAGQFVNGLIQAGEVAFQIAGQILGAFKPVTDALGNLFGIKGGPAITLPDFQPVVVGSSTLGTNLTKAADSAKSVKDQIAELERQQRESNRASAEQQETYTHQKDGISEQIRLLQEKYDLENRTTDRAELAAKIRKDEALAVDVVSSQGQAAAKRLVDERAQLRQLDRKSAFDTQKGALEDQARSVEAQAQLDREKNAKAQRTTQDTIDKLRAGQQDAPAPSVGGGQRTYQGNSQDRDDRRTPQDVIAQTPATVGILQAALDGLQQKISAIIGPHGFGGLLTVWDRIVTGFGRAGTVLGQVGTALGKLGGDIAIVSRLLGVEGGLGKQLDSVIPKVQIFFAAWSNYLPVWATLVGGAIQTAIDGFSTLIDMVDLTTQVINQLAQGNFDITKSPEVRQSLIDVLAQAAQDKRNLQNFGSAFGQSVLRSKAGFVQDRDAILGGQTPPGPQRGAATDSLTGRAGAYPQYAPGYNGPYTLPPHAPDAGLNVNLTGQIGIDENGLLRVVNMQVTGKRLAKNLGDYASSGR